MGKRIKLKSESQIKQGFRLLCDSIMYCLLVSFAILTIVSIYYFYNTFKNCEISRSMADWGNYSMCIGALFTFVSLIFIYRTYISQRAMTYKTQFDSSFFNLLGIQRNIYEKCTIKAFVDIKNKMSNIPIKGEPYSELIRIYDIATKNRKNRDIMYYFRHLYHLIMFVHKSEMSMNDKKAYINILQAQMSDEELASMVFNVIHYESHHQKPFRYIKILDQYNFFENLRSINSVWDDLIKNKFPETDFKYVGKHE